jgi:hypothetical protein
MDRQRSADYFEVRERAYGAAAVGREAVVRNVGCQQYGAVDSRTLAPRQNNIEI